MIPMLKRVREFSLTIGENTLELIANLFAMVLVERAHGQEGLGVYSYLLSLFIIAGYLSEFGVPRYVEREIPLNRKKQSEVLGSALQATLILGMLCVGLSLLIAAYYAAHTRIEEKMAAYLIIGISIPFRNLNRLKMAILHGHGKHDEVAKLEAKKRIVFLAAIFVLLMIRVRPSFLVLSFLTTELLMLLMAAKKIALPPMRQAWKDLNRFFATLKEGQRFLFTDDAFDIVLYADFLVLGLYVTSWDLGVYAEASILARFFLIIPMSIRPIFRNKYCVLAEQGAPAHASRMLQRTTAILFYVHSIMALYILLYFAEILQTFFHTRGEAMISYRIFTVIVPGLLFYAPVTASDAIYEAEGRVDSLRSIIFSIAVVNLVLNFYLIPFAGFFGAATATMISMLLYFFVFGIRLRRVYRPAKTSYLLAGGGVYLTYVLMRWLEAGWAVTLWLVPVVLFLLLCFMGFFKFEQNTLATMAKRHVKQDLLGEG